MRIAVLGAGSCFAVNLARHLIDRGDEVLAISRSPMRSKPFTSGLEYEPKYRYEQVHLTLRQTKALVLLDDFEPEIIVNFAALCEVGQSWNHPIDYYETNLMALTRLTNELQNRTWLKRFVQIGSSEVYGSVDWPAKESSPIRPSSPYAVSKAAFDMHLQAIRKTQGFPVSIVLPSNGYCEGQTLNRIIPRAIIAAKTGKKLKLQGGGAAEKSYLHADDISSAILMVMDRCEFERIHVGPKKPITIRELVITVAWLMGKKLEDIADDAPERTGQDMRYWLDSETLIKCGWNQNISLIDGLRRMIAWVEAFPELLTMDANYKHRP